MKATIIANPEAGQHAPPEDIRLLSGLLEQHEIEIVSVDVTLGPGDATTFARQAAECGSDIVFLVGGDGTIAQAVDGLVGSDTSLAVLPGGTGNVFARQLNLPVPGGLHPRPLLESARQLLSGQVRRVDVGRMTLEGGYGLSRHFLCWGGLGFDAQVNRTANADKEFRKRLGNPLAYAITTFRTLRDWRGTASRIRIDDHRTNGRLIMLVASNIQLYGMAMRLAQHAVIDDGMLDVYGFQGGGGLSTLRHGLNVLAGRHVDDPAVSIYRAKRVEVWTSRRLPVHVDGDYIGETPVVIENVPKALNLLVPACAPASLFVDGTGMSTPPQGAWEWMQRVALDVQIALKERSSTS